ncbi:peroxiredoxin 1 [Blastocladiella emersonii ATCC 22665]|nr:peroxiredoxin 1 [Blastocladiella emersonii ATCC 22665]
MESNGTKPSAYEQGHLKLGDTAPDFWAETTHGRFESFHEFIGSSWCILFSHPEDFTPVCTTELGVAALHSRDWADRNVKVIGLSCDSLESHTEWLADVDETYNTYVDFPVIADKSRRIAALYGMLDAPRHDASKASPPKQYDPFTVRSVFVIDPNRVIRLIIMYPSTCGRNFDEILRVVDSLQMSDRYDVTTPADWRPGMDCIVPPTMTTEEAKARFGQVRVVKPYLRFVNPE